MKKILMIDDDQDLSRLVSDYLESEGFNCICACDGQSGLQKAMETPPFDLIILDIMLPIKNGFEVLEALRKNNNGARVIMLTAKGDPVDKIVGLEMGADDYLAKPFNPRELLARVRAVLRRSSSTHQDGRVLDVSGHGFQLDDGQLSAAYQGRPLNLTAVEFKLLQVFIKNSGQIISRDQLFKEALGRREHDFDRSLDMHISRLRKKIWPDAAGTERLKNIRGEGYLLTQEGRTE